MIIKYNVNIRRKMGMVKNLKDCTSLRSHRYRQCIMVFTSAVLVLMTLVGCGPSREKLSAVKYTPSIRDDWKTSTPAEQGVDPIQVAELYYNAEKLETIYSLLVVRNGYLIAEKYFNKGSIDELGKRASVTKSYTSALVGIALDQGYISSVDQKMLEFFPDVADRITDPRKEQITIRNMLEMRAGYPWEETNLALWAALWTGKYLNDIADIPLTADPGTRFQYSNLTSNWLGIIVARASDTDLMSLGKEYLFNPLEVTPGEGWNRDLDGYYIGSGDILFTARDMARFGLLYLNGGEHEGKQLIPANWVRDSLKTYTVNEFELKKIGRFTDIGYGYQWWSAEVGEHHVNFAWGHGGQLIVLIDKIDMVIVTTADPFYGVDTHFDAWKYEKSILETVSDFIYALPNEQQ